MWELYNELHYYLTKKSNVFVKKNEEASSSGPEMDEKWNVGVLHSVCVIKVHWNGSYETMFRHRL